MPAEKKNTESFCLFIQLLMASAPSCRPVVIVLDNASYHHSSVTEALLAFYENQATVFWLPPYCSDLNPIERFWKHLKEKACANRLFNTIAEMIDSVDKVLTIQNDSTHSERFLFTKTFC
jgi:transposase